MSGQQRRDVLSIVLTMTCVLALVGYLVGTGATSAEMRRLDEHLWAEEERAVPSRVPLAVPYANMSEAKLSPNSEFSSRLEHLSVALKNQKKPEGPATIKQKLEALADRDRNRAYAGAPPTIPHAIEQRDVASCLACHEEGLKVGDRYASKISHPIYTNCTQCHVAAAPAMLARTDVLVNHFTAKPEPEAGPRAYAGAPPQMPHSMHMRQDCLSCHGPAGREGLRTSHPERTSCNQCHAPSAAMEQRELPPASSFPAFKVP